MVGTEPVPVTPSGEFIPTREQLDRWGIVVDAKSGEPARLKSRLDTQSQRLEITVPLDQLRIAQDQAVPTFASLSPSMPSAFFDYALYGERSSGMSRGGGQFDAGVAAGNALAHSSAIVIGGYRDGGLADGGSTVRLESAIAYDDYTGERRTIIGDSVTPPGLWGRAVRFGGVRWGTEFSLRPDLVRFPTPTLRADTALPSTVDVLVNGVVQRNQSVPAGPFEIRSLPAISGSGEVTLRVRDALGREQLISQPYYASAQLLRGGLADYALAVGAVREYYGLKSNDYGTPFMMAQYRHGVSDRLTVETRSEAGERFGMTGLGAALNVADSFILQGSVSGSRRDGHGGTSATAGIERITPKWRFALSHRHSSDSYAQLGELEFDRLVRRNTVGFAGVTLGRHSLGVSYASRLLGDQAQQLTTLSWSVPVGDNPFSMFVGYSPSGGVFGGASLVVPLGPRSSAGMSVAHSSGRQFADVSYQQAPPDESGFGYRLRAAVGEQYYSGTINHLSPHSAASVEAVQTDQGNAVRGQLSGSLRYADDRWLALRDSSQSVALVRAGDFANVRVYLDNRPVAKTDGTGRAWIAGLRPYDANRISIEHADLPLDARISTLETSVRPGPRAVARAEIPVVRGLSRLLRVRQRDGAALPNTAIARLEPEGIELPVSDSGEVWLEDAASAKTLRLSWPGGQCVARYEPAPSSGRQGSTAHDVATLLCDPAKPDTELSQAQPAPSSEHRAVGPTQ